MAPINQEEQYPPGMMPYGYMNAQETRGLLNSQSDPVATEQLARYILEDNGIVNEIVMMLRGYVETGKDKDGTVKYEQCMDAIINDYGEKRLRVILMPFNKDVKQGNWSEEDINDTIRQTLLQLVLLLEAECSLMGIKEEDKQYVISTVENKLLVMFNQAKDGHLINKLISRFNMVERNAPDEQNRRGGLLGLAKRALGF